MAHGHLNYEEVLKDFPDKTRESYKTIMRQVALIGRSNRKNGEGFDVNMNKWLDFCEKYGQPLQIATFLKLLSMDGILDNHPLPENANDVDFG